METKTLKMITESIIKQIKPEISDDQHISEQWIDDMVDDGRAALVRVLYNANDTFQEWFQEVKLEAVKENSITIDERQYFYKYPLDVITLPGKLMHDMNWKNILYLGSYGFDTNNIQRVTMAEFQEFQHHRFGNTKPYFMVNDNKIYLRNIGIQKYFKGIMCFAKPSCVPGFVRETSEYPIPLSLHRKLEIITFQHIAPKLNLPVDIVSNHSDDTKGGTMADAVKQSQNQISE